MNPSINKLLLLTAPTLTVAPVASALIDVIPIEYTSNYTPGGNSWYIDNGYTGSTGGGLSGGVGELVNGVKGTAIGSGYSQWSPYSLIDVGSAAADVVYTYYFDTAYVWDSIIQYQQVYHQAAVYQPSGFEVSFSIDSGDTFHSTIVRSMSVAESSQTIGTAQYSLLGSATGYHANAIRVVLKQSRRWTATDEVEFFASAVVPEATSFALIAGVFGFTYVSVRRPRKSGRL